MMPSPEPARRRARPWFIALAALAVSAAALPRAFGQAASASNTAPSTAALAVPPRTVTPAPAPPRLPPRAPAAPASAAAFAAATRALFDETCSQCHSGPDADGGFDVSRYGSVDSLTTARADWELVLAKLRSGEMPPAGVERREDRIAALVTFLDAEFERADASREPDPGRVTVRRLNRTEYTNTIRDLLAIEFRADKNFPTDDSGEGFDNIGDVLTISPTLMDKYLSAAASIAARAIAAEPLPKPIEVLYNWRIQNLRRLDRSNAEATHRIDYDAEYDLRIGLPGERPGDAKAVTLALWVDGALRGTRRVETKASKIPSQDPSSEERFRLPLSAGDHSFRLGFIDDDFVASLPEEALTKPRANKWIGSMTVVGPFEPTKVKASRKKVLVCDPRTGAACVDRILSTLAQRAYRRPVTRREVAALASFVELAQSEGQSVEQGIALALQAVLVSPHFLFHIEHDLYPGEPSRVHRITDVELASRLSYFLWNSMPDAELSATAMLGKLSQPRVLDAQVRRLLSDPKASALAENFAGQWLEIRNLDSIRPDPEKFPVWGPRLRDAMKTETQLFFSSMLRNDRPIAEFLDARYTFLDEFLANYYGIEGVRGPEFRRVNLTTPERGGVLSQGSVLAVSSYPTRTSVVIRGKYILQNILGTPPPPPPPDVPALDEATVATAESLRKQMELHRGNPACASCHSRMDPLGFGLENYDAIGKWRTLDGGAAVDSSGTLPSGQSFSSPAEMRKILSKMLPEFSHCLTEKMLTYALGRGLTAEDKPTVRNITQRLAASGYGLQTLVLEIVRSFPFQSRRAEAVPAPTAKN